MQILDGKALSIKIKGELKEKITKNTLSPTLAVVVVGSDPASRVYVNGKKKDCEELGINSWEFNLQENTSEEDLISLIDNLNNNQMVNGILVQLPLPSHMDEDKVIKSISPSKDVDSFHPENIGKIMLGTYSFLPCTPAGVMRIFKEYNIEIEGKNCAVIGRSNIVGKPMSLLLTQEHGTVTVAHSKTQDLTEITKRADILVVAIGKAKYVTADMVKDNAVVIDVGINRLDDGSLAGDVDFDEVAKKASAITPVPGGVGVMTRAILMENVVKAYEEQNKLLEKACL